MRHLYARRIFMGLALFFAGSAVVFGYLASRKAKEVAPAAASGARDGTEHRGAELFVTYCGSCHTAESLRPGAVSASAAERQRILQFLQDHGRASDEQDRLIMEYLASEGSGGD